MNYITKPVSIKTLRGYSRLVREIFGVSPSGPFPVLEALDKIPDVFEGSYYIIVENDALPTNVVAQCIKNEGRGFEIQIKQRIYDGARFQNIGAYLGFILHEICHVFMYELGYTPCLQRSFRPAPIFCEIEWQVLTLTGEVALPYDETKDMSIHEMIEQYHVSKGFAKHRKKMK